MKNTILFLIISAILFSCGGSAPKEYKLDKFDISMLVPELKKNPEFKELTFDKMLGKYEFRVDKYRVNIVEIEESIYPENINTLSEAISAGEKFDGLMKGDKYPNGTMTMPNGAFGVLYSKKGSSGKAVKDYIFYFKKGNRYFRIVPVLNNDLEGLDQQLAMIESLK